MKNYKQVVVAAEAVSTNKTRDMWTLADAIHDTVPSGNRDKLNKLSEQLKADGFDYSGFDVWTMWETSDNWPVGKRLAEAAYSTHRYIDPTSDDGKLFIALCAVARGEMVARPNHVVALNWGLMSDKVIARKRTFKVTGSDLKIASLHSQPKIVMGATQVHSSLYDRHRHEEAALNSEIVAAIGHQSALTAWLSAERFVNAAVVTATSNIPDEVREVIERIQGTIQGVLVPVAV